MKIKFYGSSHGLPERDRFCTSVLVEAGENHYMVDAGVPVADMLIRDGMRPEVLRAIFLTHLHGDHVDGLLSYLDLTSWFYKRADPEIFTPSLQLEEAANAWLKMLFRTPPRSFRYREIYEGEIFSDDVIKVRAIMNRHQWSEEDDFVRHSYSFAIEEVTTGEKVLFTGDLKGGMEDFPNVAFEEHFDTIVIEGAHTELCDSSEVLKRCRTDKFIIGHVAPEIVNNVSVEALRESLAVPLSVAGDMAEYNCR